MNLDELRAETDRQRDRMLSAADGVWSEYAKLMRTLGQANVRIPSLTSEEQQLPNFVASSPCGAAEENTDAG